jgi:hypothetical protein
MKTKKEILTNRKGFDFEVDMEFVEFDYNGKVVNEWCVDERSSAKMIVYVNATELLPIEEENKRIDEILAVGVLNILSGKGGAYGTNN